MQKFIKYIIIGIIAILIFCTGFISGCVYSNKSGGKLEQENTILRESISNYADKLELSERKRSAIIRGIKSVESEVVEIHRDYEGVETGFRELYEERSDIGQGIQEVRDGLNEMDSEMRSYIEGTENP